MLEIIEEIVKSTDILEGDYIKSFDITTERSRYNRVDTVLNPEVQEDNQILFKVNDSNSSIITSMTHPMCYYNSNQSSWSYKSSSEIQPGDLIKAENKVSTIRSVHPEYFEDKLFIDFEVQVDNNYYVSNDSKDFYVIHNSRPGALAAYFSWWHYDAPDLIELKEEGGTEDRRARKLQYGVKWNKLFTQRILDNETITLFDPKETPELLETWGSEFEKWYLHYENKAGIKKKTMQAIDLAFNIAKQRIETGNIYIFFEENVQNQNNFNDKIYSSNLCAEIMLSTKAVKQGTDKLIKDLSTGSTKINEEYDPGLIALCNLSSINLMTWMKLSPKKKEKIIYNLLRASDNLIDYAFYPAKEGEIFNRNYRAIGVGVTNYAQFLATLGLSFSDPEALEETNDIMEDIYWYLMNASIRLAGERGRFEYFHNTKYAQGLFTHDMYQGPYTYKLKKDWNSLRQQLITVGARFATVMAIAPTATSSLILKSTEGIEPIRKLVSLKTGTYSCKQLAPNIQKLRSKYDIAWDIPSEDMINLASVRQRWVDQGQSFSLYYKDRNDSAYEILKDILVSEKMGLKSMYYAHSPKEDDELEEACLSCSV